MAMWKMNIMYIHTQYTCIILKKQNKTKFRSIISQYSEIQLVIILRVSTRLTCELLCIYNFQTNLINEIFSVYEN